MLKYTIYIFSVAILLQDVSANSNLMDAFSIVNQGHRIVNLVDVNRDGYLRIIKRLSNDILDFVEAIKYNDEAIAQDGFFPASNTGTKSDNCTQAQNAAFSSAVGTALTAINNCYKDVPAQVHSTLSQVRNTRNDVNNIYRRARRNLNNCMTENSGIQAVGQCILRKENEHKNLYAKVVNESTETANRARNLVQNVFKTNAVCQSTAVAEVIQKYHSIVNDYIQCIEK